MRREDLRLFPALWHTPCFLLYTPYPTFHPTHFKTSFRQTECKQTSDRKHKMKGKVPNWAAIVNAIDFQSQLSGFQRKWNSLSINGYINRRESTATKDNWKLTSNKYKGWYTNIRKAASDTEETPKNRLSVKIDAATHKEYMTTARITEGLKPERKAKTAEKR